MQHALCVSVGYDYDRKAGSTHADQPVNTNLAKLHTLLMQVLLDANCGAHLQLDYLQAADAADPRQVPPLGMLHTYA